MCVIAVAAQASAEVADAPARVAAEGAAPSASGVGAGASGAAPSAAEIDPDPAAPESRASVAYLWIAAGTIAAIVALHARGRRPLGLGPERVRWPIAPGPSVFLMALLMMAGAAAASGAVQLAGEGSSEGLRRNAIASLANGSAQVLLIAGIWWAHSGLLGARASAQSPAGDQSEPVPPAHAAAPMRPMRAAAIGALAMAIGWSVTQAAGVIGLSIQQRISGEPAPGAAHRTLEAMGQSGDALWIAVTAFAAVVLAPLVEEILYRGALQQALKGIGVPRTLALFGASALFAIAHWGSLVSGAQAGALAMLMLLGLIFGWAYERTGSMWAPVAAHATFNAANLAILLAQR